MQFVCTGVSSHERPTGAGAQAGLPRSRGRRGDRTPSAYCAHDLLQTPMARCGRGDSRPAAGVPLTKGLRAIVVDCGTFVPRLPPAAHEARQREGDGRRRTRERTLPRASAPFTVQTTDPADLQVLPKADEGTRTLDLLHGKCERPFAPVRARSLKTAVCSDSRPHQRTRANPSERRTLPFLPRIQALNSGSVSLTETRRRFRRRRRPERLTDGWL